MPEGHWWKNQWENVVGNFTLVLREILWDVMDWIDLAQDRSYWSTIVNTAMNVVKKLYFIPSSGTRILSFRALWRFSYEDMSLCLERYCWLRQLSTDNCRLPMYKHPQRDNSAGRPDRLPTHTHTHTHSIHSYTMFRSKIKLPSSAYYSKSSNKPTYCLDLEERGAVV